MRAYGIMTAVVATLLAGVGWVLNMQDLVAMELILANIGIIVATVGTGGKSDFNNYAGGKQQP